MGTTSSTTAPMETAQKGPTAGNGGGKGAAQGITSKPILHWQLPIMLTEDGYVKPEVPWQEGIKLGDMVSFTSGDGNVRVVFVGTNPFSTDPGFVISDSGAHEVKYAVTKDDPGTAYCWIKLRSSGKWVGYGDDAETKAGYTVPPPKT